MSTTVSTPKASSFGALLRLIHYARKYRGRVWWATSMSIANKLFDIAPEILIGIAIDVTDLEQIQAELQWILASGVREFVDEAVDCPRKDAAAGRAPR